MKYNKDYFYVKYCELHIKLQSHKSQNEFTKRITINMQAEKQPYVIHNKIIQGLWV